MKHLLMVAASLSGFTVYVHRQENVAWESVR